MFSKSRRTVLAAVACSILLSACSTLPPKGIEPVAQFDIQRYLGQWYEIARLDHSFERGLTDVKATYSLAPNGSIQVINEGYNTQRQKWKKAVGRGLFNGDPTIGSLKVSFFGPFYGGYHIMALDQDYQWVLVAGDSRDYLWMLARDKTLSGEIKDALIAKAQEEGFQTDKLIWVDQTRTDAP